MAMTSKPPRGGRAERPRAYSGAGPRGEGHRVRAPFVRIAPRLASGTAAGLFSLPLAWMLVASLCPPGLPPSRGIEWIPEVLAWENYARIFNLLPLGGYVFNSVLVSAIAVPGSLAIASWAGFAIARLGRPSRISLILASIGLMLVPVTALWLTRLLTFKWLGWFDSHLALVAPALMGTNPLFVLLYYRAFRRLPADLIDMARLEGATAFTAWRLIGMPLVRSTTVAAGLLTFVFYWSDFINPLLYLKSQALYTLPVGLQQLQQLDQTNWPLHMAGAVVFTVPALAVFSVAQRFFWGEEETKEDG